MFLCRTVEHDTDYEAMLAKLTPEQLIVWEAYYCLEPWGDDWLQAARIETAILNTMGGQDLDATERIPNIDNCPPTEDVEASQLNAGFRGMAGM